jgi:predicted ATPase/class 3 adenylate cyclase
VQPVEQGECPAWDTAAVAAPSGTVTFLFTDIEGSTHRWQTAPEAMRQALQRHDTILRSAIDGHGGYVFSTGGDGFAAAFARAGAAVAAAADAQIALGVEPWPEGAAIRVRMGVHTGEAEERDGDYFGSAVNRTARLMGVAHGGQVVCSAVTAGLVDADVGLVDLGDHRLRDLDRSMRVFQVGGGRFPPLQSLDSLPGNLPSLASLFVGRREELSALAKELGSHRLVTLTGVGGVGKTRLALQVAAELLPGFADGAWMCELAAAAADDDLPQVVAIALGVVPRAGMTLTESVVDFLRPRQLLVVLDNCEHLLDAAAGLVAAVLAGAPGVRILSTSREGLGIPGEHVWPLRSLSVPADVAGAEASEAVLLFADRAAGVSPGFVLGEAHTAGVVEVCRRLDGIPLAIELAAARVAVMTPAEIAAHLDERFRLLTGGRRGRVERHQTLRAALEWSYSLLIDTDRAVFDRLGAFPTSFDEAAAVAVCGGQGIERWDVIDALASLVAKSMVGADQAGDTTRYQLLETLRHFARDHAGDLDGLRRRHATHYAVFAEEAGVGLASPDELAWRPRVTAELDNLRAAAGWAFDAPDREDLALGIRLLDGLAPEPATLHYTGIYALAATALLRVDELSPAGRAVVFNAAAHAALNVGQYEQAKKLAADAIAESEAVTFAWNGSLWVLSYANVVGGDPAAARAVLAEGRCRVDAEGASDWLNAGLHSLTSFIAIITGDHETARTEVEENLVIARRLGAPTLLANALTGHALMIADQRPQEALAAAEEVMRLIEAGAADSNAYSGAAHIAATIRSAQGDIVGAASVLHAAIEHEAQIGRRGLIAGGLRIAAIVLAATRHGNEAAATLIAAANGPVLGHYAPATWAGIEVVRSERAAADVAAALGPAAYTQAQQRGASMSYDEIIAYTLDHLSRLTESESDRQ